MASDDPTPLVVLVVDDHPVFLRGVSSLLIGQNWVSHVVTAESVGTAQEAMARTVPDLAILDMMLPVRRGENVALTGGLEILGSLRRHHPECRILMLSMATDRALVQAALAGGAQGYLAKDTDPELVLNAAQTVANGGLVLGPSLAQALHRETQAGRARPPAPFQRLTPRELSVAEQVARGFTNLEIAKELELAEKTIRNIVSTILDKTSLPNRVTLALHATESGLNTSDVATHPWT